MSGRGKRKSRSGKAGLILSVGRVSRYLRERGTGLRVGVNASVFMAAVMEYLVFETIELAGIVSKANGAPRITPEHIRTLVLNDPELGALLHRHPSLQTARVSDGSRALRDISAAVAITARTAVEGVSVITEAIACATGALFKMKVE